MKTVVNLGLISCTEVITTDQIKIIDRICQNVWDTPNVVRFYNMITENNYDNDIYNWSNLYFGCKFVMESPREENLRNSREKESNNKSGESNNREMNGKDREIDEIRKPVRRVSSLGDILSPRASRSASFSGFSQVPINANSSSPALLNSPSYSPLVSAATMISSGSSSASPSPNGSPRKPSLSAMLGGSVNSILSSNNSGISPRFNLSPRRFSKNALEAFQIMADTCTHIIILGSNSNLALMVKLFPSARLIILAN